MSASDHITTLLQSWQNGDETARDELFELIYRELRRIAAARLRNEMRPNSLQATELVHEIYPQLARQRQPWQNRSHFYALASECMRRFLVDRARTKHRQKRGGDAVKISLSDLKPSEICRIEKDDEVLAVDRALEKLSKTDETAATIIKHRYFGGMNREEIAEVLDVSPSTVDRTYRFAKAWLKRELAFEFSPYLLNLGQIKDAAEFVRQIKFAETWREKLPESLLKKIDDGQNAVDLLPEIVAEINKSLLGDQKKNSSADKTEIMPESLIKTNRFRLEETFDGQITRLF